MWGKFKWHMFITSFIPLWVTIIFLDMWDIISTILQKWNNETDFMKNLKICFLESIVQISSIVVIMIVLFISVRQIKKFLQIREKSSNNKTIVKQAKKESSLTTQYVLSYILPLVAFDFGKIKDLIIFLLFFFVLAFLCIRNNNIYTNIYLEFKKYKIYTCTLERTIIDKPEIYENCFVLSKNNLEQYIGNEIRYWDFDNYHYINIQEVGE